MDRLRNIKNEKRIHRLNRFVSPNELVAKAGDLIEVDRTIYSHWAVYVGDGQAIHVTGDTGDFAEVEATVVEGALTAIAGQSLVRVNNKNVPAKGRGLVSRPAQEVVRAARQCVGRTVVYNMITKNCEHYVTQWKYGLPWSDQASTALGAMAMFTNSSLDKHKAHVAMALGISDLLQKN